MKRIQLWFEIVLGLSLTPGVGHAAPPVIGTVTAASAFRLNGDTVMTNGTLTEGTVLESGEGPSVIRLAAGARLSLSADSRGKLYSDHMLLEKGETRLENGVGFHLVALGLTIRPDRGISTGRIGLLPGNRLRVAALTGSFRVLNERGLLVANVAAGSALAFEPVLPVSPASASVTGSLTQRSGRFLLEDQVTRVVVEVTGQGLAPHVGRVVQVSGTLNAAAQPVAGASEVIAASSIQAMAAPSAIGSVRGSAAMAGVGDASRGVGISAPPTVLGGVAASAATNELAGSRALASQSRSENKGVSAGPPATPPGPPPGRPPVTPPDQPPGKPPGRPPLSR